MTSKELREYEKGMAKVIAKFLLKEIETNAVLSEKLETTTKTLKGCIKYLGTRASKFKEDNVAIVEDAVVYGWVVEYFTNDTIKEQERVEITKEVKVEPKPKKAEKVIVEQLSLFEDE